MENKFSNNPSTGKIKSGIDQAYQTAREKLTNIVDVQSLCEKTGSKCSNPGTKYVSLEYFHQGYNISLRTGDIEPQPTSSLLSVREQLLVMHYLLAAKGTEPVGKLITFQDLPDGNVYYPTFLKRAVNPLVTAFGNEPLQLPRLAVRFGGVPGGVGDASVTVNAFPCVPITIVLWQGDDEFAARGNIIFDAGISNYLPTEDVTIICETLSWKLIKASSTL